MEPYATDILKLLHVGDTRVNAILQGLIIIADGP